MAAVEPPQRSDAVAVGARAEPPFSSRRSPALASPAAGFGMVACAQPLAAECGRAVLAAGGNAADAAVAVAAGMALCEPCSTGLGGDCFALVYEPRARGVAALNGSGRAPRALTLEAARARAGAGAAALPSFDPLCVTVPGAAAGWSDTLARWGSGRLSMAQVLAPAARLAREGVPVAPIAAESWRAGEPQLKAWAHAGEAADAACLLVRDGGKDGGGVGGIGGELRAPRAGELFRNAALADSFDELARSHDAGEGAAGFYGGRVGRAIAEAVRAAGGVLDLEDLVAHRSTFPAPISTDFCGVRVYEVPPNGQGIAALMALQTIEAVLKSGPPAARETDPLAALNAGGAAGGGGGGGGGAGATSLSWTGGLELASLLPGLADADRAALARLAALGHNSAAHLHLVAEALRLAFADARTHVADGEFPGAGGAAAAAAAAALLSPAYAVARAAAFDPRRAAADVVSGSPLARSDTVSFSVVDAGGLAVSFINSNYMGFGTGLCPRGVGFSLQNRGAGFSLVEGHANCVAPGKRPYHTIIPLMLCSAGDGAFLAAASNMGGFMQPQGHVQLVLNLLAFGADAQTAVDCARLCIADGTAGSAVALEDGIAVGVADALAAAGHRLGPGARGRVAGFARALFGRAQIVLRHPRSGVLWGGSDGRGDGLALACRCG